MDSFFEIKDFSCGYGDKFMIHDINFSVPIGGFAGIIGPNGSGKTTLFRGITGELDASSGDISLEGKSVRKMRIRERARNIAIVSQNFEPANITVEDYILMGRLPYHGKYQFFDSKKDFEIAQKYMELTGVEYLRNKNLYQLSGGQQQMVSIARALTQEPRLLLLDEPTSHLDIKHQVNFLNLVQRLNDQFNLTVLMTIHDLNLAGEYCDQLILFNDGQVFAKGKPEEILTYQNLEAVYGTQLVTDVNPLSGKPVVFLVSERVMNESKNKLCAK